MRVIALLLLSCLLSGAKTIAGIGYGKHPLQQIDLHLPTAESTTAHPVIIAIHGGGWAFGDKTNQGFLQPKTKWLNGKGYIVASINYRLSPAVTHPAHIDDVCSAIAWVQSNIAKHGGDPKTILLLGHSAGAHLAALAAVDHKRLMQAGANPKAIKGVILIDGAAYEVPRQIANASLPKYREMYLRAFTKNPEVQRDASPTLRVADLKDSPPPFLILHVARRTDAKDQADRLAKALQAKGGKASVVAVAGKSHATINRDLGKPDDPTTTAVTGLLDGL